MNTTIEIGMDNKLIPCVTKCHLDRFTVITDYYTLDGKKIMLQVIRDSISYYPEFHYMEFPDTLQPKVLKGSIVSPSILGKGYSGHDFKMMLQ